jgi:hypothetical protein
MLRGDTRIDSVRAVVCHDERRVSGTVLAGNQFVAHVVGVQAMRIRDEGKH